MTTNPVGPAHAVHSQLREWGSRWGVRAAWRCRMLHAAGPRTGTPRFSGRLADRHKMWVGTMLVALSLALVGCSSTANLKQVYHTVIASMRSPGEKMVQTPEDTREKYSCVAYKKRVFHLEEVQILPAVVTSGKEINQRLRYAFCPSIPSDVLRGHITRAIYFEGRKIFRDTTDYEFKPGTWIIDAFVGIPEEAQSGVYAIDVVLKYKNQTIKDSHSFVVKRK